MNNAMIKQIYKDYEEILSNEAGKRVFGGIFYGARLNSPGLKNDYQQGLRDLALIIANTIREVNPSLIAECEKAYKEMMRSYDDGDDRSDNDSDNNDYRAECTD